MVKKGIFMTILNRVAFNAAGIVVMDFKYEMATPNYMDYTRTFICGLNRIIDCCGLHREGFKMVSFSSQ